MTVAAFLSAVTPLVVVPLGVITFYLRAIREHQVAKHRELAHRLECAEESVRSVSEAVSGIERDYTTKEEWLRESLHARRQLERLTEMMVKVQTELEGSHSMVSQFARAVMQMTERLGHPVSQCGGMEADKESKQ